MLCLRAPLLRHKGRLHTGKSYLAAETNGWWAATQKTDHEALVRDRGGDPKTDHASLVDDDTESMAATCPPYRPGRLASATASVPTLCLSIFQFLAQLIPIS